LKFVHNAQIEFVEIVLAACFRAILANVPSAEEGLLTSEVLMLAEAVRFLSSVGRTLMNSSLVTWKPWIESNLEIAYMDENWRCGVVLAFGK
jgi:hypothetical protein